MARVTRAIEACQGEYLASATSGLSTNAFLGDPRTYGVTAGVHF